MALSLLNGTTGAVDFTTESGTPKSWQGIVNYISFDVDRGMFQQVTFGSTNWSKQIVGINAGSGRLEGYMAKGVTHADPLYFASKTTATPFIFTADTGCTIAGSLWVSRQHHGQRAYGNSEFNADYVVDGAPTSVWVTT